MAFTFTLEDGTGVTGANAYVSLADVKQYWDNMVYDYSGFTDEQLQQYIVKATRNIDMIYGAKFVGTKYSSTQGLMWPRTDAYDMDDFYQSGVPDVVEYATAEAAYLVSQGTSFLSDTADAGVKLDKVKVDVIEVEQEYSASSPVDKQFPVINALIKPVLNTGKYGSGYKGLIRV